MGSFLHRLGRRVRALISRDALNRDVRDEMRLHLELEAEELAHMHRLAPDEAQRRAAIAFGGVDRYAEAHHDARGVRWLEETLQDARYAARSLRRSPGFTVSATLVLALGIGASTAIFSAVDAVLIARLPYAKDEQLVRIQQQNSPTNRFGASVVDYQAIAVMQRSFTAVGAARRRQAEVALSEGERRGTARRAFVASVDAGFFRTLGTTAAHGRVLSAVDSTPGIFVTVASHAFALAEFGGDGATAINKTVAVDGVIYTIVGVLPAERTDLAGIRADLWSMLRLEPPQRRGPFNLQVIGRLRDGVTVDAAARDLASISERIFPTWQSSFQDRAARLTPFSLRDWLLGNARQTLALFGAAVVLVLLIAVANVAGLTLVRVAGRSREAVLRTVLGASRTRLARLLITESLVLAALGAATGALLAPLLLRALAVVGPPIARLSEASVDLRSIAFAGALAVLTGVLVGLYPVLSLFRRNYAVALRSGDREVGAGRSTHLLRGALVTAQLALALPLLATSGLLLNSFVRLQRVDVGFDTRVVDYVRVSLPLGRYNAPELAFAFWTRALPRVAELPGVIGVGYGDAMPPDEPSDINNFDLVYRPVPVGSAQPVAPWVTVSSGYFDAIGVRLMDGRAFTETDTGTAPPVVLVSESWAAKYSADRSPVGRQLISGGCTSCPPITVVGVVGDVKYLGLSGNGEAVYVPAGQSPSPSFNLFVRARPGAGDVTERVRAVLQSIDPALALDDAGAMEERVYKSITPQRHWTTLLGAFAVAAVTLAAVGIFGMLSYLVAARRREIGVRVALGASPLTIVGMVLGRGLSFAMAGAVIGLALSFVVRRRLETILFGVSAADPTTLAAATALFLVVAAVASLLPARRAATVSPMEAMRSD